MAQRRDERRDGFVSVVKKAMEAKLGDDAEEALKVLCRKGITRALGRRALELASSGGRFTVFSVVDALTRIAGEMKNAGDRAEADQKASLLLSLVG